MTYLSFTYNPYDTTFPIENNYSKFFLATSNSFYKPIVSYVILNVFNIQNANNVYGTIIVSNQGTITFNNYTGSFNPLKTYQGTVTFLIIASTGIFSSYINGSIIIDASWGEKNTIYVFKE
jgi:hypothetical protein